MVQLTFALFHVQVMHSAILSEWKVGIIIHCDIQCAVQQCTLADCSTKRIPLLAAMVGSISALRQWRKKTVTLQSQTRYGRAVR